ncbi:hypothetical protein [Sphingomonas crusticola]|uniref:hypothetical protein n=1 Tax=Sphingomonas crusticola TaxID=1697973 RepID=UPI000E266BA6|nr:hypothetical protein [Sphingomonas crusticola]
MDLLERYLHAVRWQLPAAKADDIIAELRDVLLARQEDREEALGRPLTRPEMSALIKEFGHPLVVAARYRKQQWLIGPDVFPFYLFVLRITLLVIVGVEIALGAGRTLFGGQPLPQVIAQTWGGIWMSLIVDVGVLTIIFAILERTGFPADHLRRWKPEQLPDLRYRPKRAWEAGCEIALDIMFLLWWAGMIHIPVYTNAANFRMEAAPIFAELYWPIFALAAARLIQNLLAWLRPRWGVVQAFLAGATTIGGLVLVAIIYRAGHWVNIVSTGMPTDKAAELAAAINLSIKIGLVGLAAAWAWHGLVELWRLLRRR